MIRFRRAVSVFVCGKPGQETKHMMRGLDVQLQGYWVGYAMRQHTRMHTSAVAGHLHQRVRDLHWAAVRADLATRYADVERGQR